MDTFFPGQTIGIIGGGQLGRMSAIAASYLGYQTIILEEETNEQLPSICKTITGSYKDEKTLMQFSKQTNVITIEFENVPIFTLNFLSKNRPIRPGIDILSICRNRIYEKTFLNKNNIETAPWQIIENDDHLNQIKIFPSILKTAESGYDGHGQCLLLSKEDLIQSWNCMKKKPCIVEQKINFIREISVIVARNDQGIAIFPICDNKHKNHMLYQTKIPINISTQHEKQAKHIATKIAEIMNLRGLLCIEMFELEDRLLVNELAPRPHNSGHWTLDACITSQFEQHIRSICNLPLGATDLLTPCTMTNIIGEDIHLVPNLLTDPYNKIHIYGKTTIRKNRKMGHFTRLTNKNATY